MMAQQQIRNRIKQLENRLNAMTRRCPLRFKAAARQELRSLTAQLERTAA